MDKRTLTGENPEKLEEELREQFRGLDVFVWREAAGDGQVKVSAVPAHQVYTFVQDIANKVCWIIDRHSTVKLKPDRQDMWQVLLIIRSFESGAFIGWHGQNLDAVELLINAVVSQHIGLRLDITVDIDQYRNKRLSFLDSLVKRTVHEIEHDHSERELPGLLPKERRYVHTVMSNHPYLTTESRGRGNQRTLYIIPRGDLG
jgi:predicted RNA-binding protein Jag